MIKTEMSNIVGYVFGLGRFCLSSLPCPIILGTALSVTPHVDLTLFEIMNQGIDNYKETSCCEYLGIDCQKQTQS